MVPATTRAVWPGAVEGTWNVGLHFDIGTAAAGKLALALYRTPEPVAAAAPAPDVSAVPAPRHPATADEGVLAER